MPSSRPKTFSRSRVATAIIMNLTATPGLGSLMCGRKWAGLGQLAFSVTGFCLIMVWMLKLIYRSTMVQMEEPAPAAPADWMRTWGVLLFGIGWLWSLVTSLSLWREAKAAEQTMKANVPPKITDENKF